MNLTRNKKLFLIGLIIALVIAIPLTIFILQKQQEIRSKAQASTTLTFSPLSSSTNPLQKNAGEEFTLNLDIDPGVNLVSSTRLDITYDASVIEPTGVQPFTLNPAALPIILQGPIYTSGKISIILSSGNDPTRALSTPSTLGTIKFKALSNTSSPSLIRYGDATVVTSIADTDSASENVLSSSTPSYVQVGLPTTPTTSPNTCTPSSQNFYANLQDEFEIPANSSGGNGFATIQYNQSTGTYSLAIHFGGFSADRVTMAHIHSPATITTTAPPSLSLFNWLSETFDNPYEKQITIPSSVLNDMRSGNAYINIHTYEYPDGIIRGQITCDYLSPTPTPTPSIRTSPTLTPTPVQSTPTSAPSVNPVIRKGISLEIYLHGIGASGDNTNPTNYATSNKNVLHPQRSAKLTFYSENNDIVYSPTIPIYFDTLKYINSIDFYTNTQIPDGKYYVKTKVDGFLASRTPITYTFTDGVRPQIVFTLVNGDTDNNNSLDILDYGALLDCGYGDLDPLPISDPTSTFNSTACQAHITPENADLNDDGTINRNDFNLFIREIAVQSGD